MLCDKADEKYSPRLIFATSALKERCAVLSNMNGYDNASNILSTCEELYSECHEGEAKS